MRSNPTSYGRVNKTSTYGGLKKFNPLTYNDPNGSELEAFWYSKTASATDTQVIDAIGDETRPIQSGRCYSFDGVNDFVNTNFTPSNGAITMAIWHKSSTRDSGGIFGNWQGTNGGLMLYRDNSSIFWYGGVTSNANVVMSPSVLITDDNYHRYVLVVDSVSGRLYIDGVLAASDSSANVLAVRNYLNVGMIYIGGYNYANNTDVTNEPTQGQSFDFQVWDKGFDDADALFDFENVGKLAHERTGSSLLASNLKLQYTMDEQGNTTALDRSGNGNNGIIKNATLSSFHATDIEVPYSWQNEVGYSETEGSSNLGSFIPRNEATPTLDVLGNTLQYSGRVKYNLDMVESYCATLDGTNDYGDLDNTDLFSKENDFTGSVSFIDVGGAVGTIINSIKDSDNRFAIQINQGAYNVTIGVWNGSSYASKSATITTGIPYKLDFSYDSSAHSMTATLNGVAMTGTITPGITADVGCYIGSLTNGSVFFNGRIWGLSIGDLVFPIAEGKGSRSYSKVPATQSVDWVNINESTFYNGDGVLFDGSNDYGDLPSGSMLDLTKDFVVSYTVKDLVPSVSHNMVLACSFSDIPYLGWHHTGLVEVRNDTGTTATFVGKGTNTYPSGRFVYTKVGNQLTLVVYSLTGSLLATETVTWTNTGNICINRISGQNTGYRLNGRLLNLQIQSDGKEIYNFEFNETSGTKSYSYINQYIDWINTTESSLWANRQDVYHNNITDGFSKGVNFIKYSEQFDNAGWTKASTTFNHSAKKLIPSSSGYHRGLYQILTGGITSSAMSLTFKLKYAGIQWVNILSINGSSETGAWFDVLNGVVGQVVAGYSATITATQDGGFNCKLTIPSGIGMLYAQVSMVDTNGGSSVTVNGDNGVIVEACQLEEGAVFTQYQKTKSSPTAGAYIPAVSDTLDYFGNTLTNPAGNFHNGAETKLRVPEAPALRQADTSSFLYTGGTPNDIGYEDIVANIDDQIFADVSIETEKQNIMVYDQVLINPALKKVKKFTNQ